MAKGGSPDPCFEYLHLFFTCLSDKCHSLRCTCRTSVRKSGLPCEIRRLLASKFCSLSPRLLTRALPVWAFYLRRSQQVQRYSAVSLFICGNAKQWILISALLCDMHFLFLGQLGTGLPAYSDSVGTAQKCHCKRLSLYLMIFSIRRSFFGPKTVTVPGISL